MNRRTLRIALIAAALMLGIYLLGKAPSDQQLFYSPHRIALCVLALLCPLMRGFLIPAHLATSIVSLPAWWCYQDAPIPTFIVCVLAVIQFGACAALAAYFQRLREPRPNALRARLLLAMPLLLIALGAVAFLTTYVIYLTYSAAYIHAPFSITSFAHLARLAALPGAIFWLAYSLHTLARMLRPHTVDVDPLPQSPVAPEASPLPPYPQHQGEGQKRSARRPQRTSLTSWDTYLPPQN